MTQITRERLAYFADENIRSGGHELENFNKKFAADPAYAFEWSDNAFKAAAKIHVGRFLKDWLDTEREKPLTADDIMNEVNRMVVRAARWPERSTSVQSNVMKQEIASVWAELSAKQQGW